MDEYWDQLMSDSKSLKIGDIVQSWTSNTFYQIIEIEGDRFKLKHPNGQTYSKTGTEIEYYFHKFNLIIEEFNKLPPLYKDYPDHLLKKNTVKPLENEEWAEIKIKDLKHNYLISSIGRVKRTDYYNIRGNEESLIIYGDYSFGIPEKVYLVKINNEGDYFLLNDLIRSHFSEEVFLRYKSERSDRFDKTQEIVRSINESAYSKDLDFTSLLEENAYTLPERKLVFVKRYRNWYSPKYYYNREILKLKGFSLLTIVYHDYNEYYFEYIVGTDSIIINKESPFFRNVVARELRTKITGHTNLLGYKELIAHIRILPLSLSREVHEDLIKLIDLHLPNAWKY